MYYKKRRNIMNGTIELFKEKSGFGFIKPDEEEKDIMFYGKNFKTQNISIFEGQRVEFDVIDGPKGKEAINIVVIK